MKNNKKNTPCPDKFIFNQKTKQHKWPSSDDKNNLYYSWPCPKSLLLYTWLLHLKWQWSLDIQEPNNHEQKTRRLLGFTMWIHWLLNKNHLFSFPTWINFECLYVILEPTSFKTTTEKAAKNILTHEWLNHKIHGPWIMQITTNWPNMYANYTFLN